jgi:hypothetical protein
MPPDGTAVTSFIVTDFIEAFEGRLRLAALKISFDKSRRRRRDYAAC